MKPIPFSPPRIDEKTIEADTAVLRSGWITTGPQTRAFENDIKEYCDSGPVLCLNSWTNAVEMVLYWFGIGPGDEVIVPAYTYAATANVVVHLGATPVMVDCAPNSAHMDIEVCLLITMLTWSCRRIFRSVSNGNRTASLKKNLDDRWLFQTQRIHLVRCTKGKE